MPAVERRLPRGVPTVPAMERRPRGGADVPAVEYRALGAGGVNRPPDLRKTAPGGVRRDESGQGEQALSG